MICPTCKQNDQKSIVHEGCMRVTSMWCAPFYDENGVRHHHDRNAKSMSYTCSNGHSWEEAIYNYCHCGWTTEPNQENS